MDLEVAEAATTQLYNNGFCMIKDPRIGSSIEKMKANELSFKFSEEAGFDFWHENVKQNLVYEGILRKVESDVGSQYILAYCGTLAPDPGHICTLRNGGNDLGILIVQLWPKGSSAAFYSGSHTVDVPRVRAANKTWEVALGQLEGKGCDAKHLQDSFQEGGFVIFDARIAFERKVQRCYYYTYIRVDLLEEWRARTAVFGLRPPTSQNFDQVEKLGVYVVRDGG